MRAEFNSKWKTLRNARSLSKTPFGFTLAELIVVITVLAILATVGFVMLSGHLSSARDSSRMTEVGQISRSVELSAIQNGKYPMPATSESVALRTFTGGVSGWTLVTQWAATSANVRDLGGSFGRNKQAGPYVYSVLGDGAAYQVAAEFENGVSRSNPGGVPEAYAASKTAYVEGTYKPDPSLPSLITSSGSVSGTWLFSPDACFVTNGGPNLYSTNSGCVPKKSLALKSVDPGLVGYWDMETICAWGSCGAGNDGKLADLSGNGGHADWTGSLAPTQIAWAMGVARNFYSWALIATDDLNAALDGEALTMEAIVKVTGYSNPYPRVFHNRHFAMNFSNCAAYPGQSNCDGQNALWISTNTFGAYVQGMSGMTVTEAVNDDPVRTSWLALQWQYYHVVTTYSKWVLKTYANGKLQYAYSRQLLSPPLRFGSPTTNTSRFFAIGWFVGNNRTRDFQWIIDEAKIYSRALDDDEIRNRAISSGLFK